MRGVLGAILLVYMIVLAGRAVMSWFPVRPGTFLSSLNGILFDLTEPVLRPVRRVVPPAGPIDLSFMVVFFAVVILRSVVAGA